MPRKNGYNSESSEEEYIPSKRANKSRRVVSESVTQSQLSQPSCSQTQQPLDDRELNRLAALCANFFIVANCKKIPMKRADIGKLVPKAYSRRTGDVIQTASVKLEEVFGYKLVEVDKKGQFILVNLLNLASVFEGVLPMPVQPREAAVTVLRTNLLISVFMCGEVMQEAEIRDFLKKFSIDVEAKENHPLLGNVQKLVYQDFVRQGYLEVNHHKDIEHPFKEIRWGFRAKLELNKKELLQFVCKVYGQDIKPEMWTEQWRAANDGSTRTDESNE